MKRKKTGFTLVELLTVLAIITMLIGLLVPAMATVRRFAKETKQSAQLTTIGLALTAFRDDYGEYPPSGEVPYDYTGAQTLTEALLGWDLLGFHPDSAWRADGLDAIGGLLTYDPPKTRDVEPSGADGIPDTLTERRGRYLELGTTNVFNLGITTDHDGLFENTTFSTETLAPDTFVICDVFGVRRVRVGGKTVKAGTPILYYRANTSRKLFDKGDPTLSIYDLYNNFILIGLGVLTPDGTPGKPHQLGSDGGLYFYDEAYKVLDPKATAASGIPWPHRPDSYILISAGMDGEYGTGDDITNFGD